MLRTTRKTVVFKRPFVLAGLEGPQSPGTYTIETEEELLDTLSLPAYRRIATLIHVSAGPGVRQTFDIDPADLDRALAQDAAG